MYLVTVLAAYLRTLQYQKKCKEEDLELDSRLIAGHLNSLSSPLKEFQLANIVVLALTEQKRRERAGTTLSN